jgi:hypothetical protein
MEKTERNLRMVEDFKNFISIQDIADKNKITHGTAAEIIIRLMGVKEYKKLRADKIRMTAKRYGGSYLSKRKYK